MVRRLGRKGRGPGEFESTEMIGLLADTIWVSDRLLRRITYFPDFGKAKPLTRSVIGRSDGTLEVSVPRSLASAGRAIATVSMASRLGEAIRGTPRARVAGVHQRPRIALVGGGASRTIGIHRRGVRVCDDPLVAE